MTGSHTISASRHEVWRALQDPAVLARTLPGVQRLEVTGPDAYAVTITAGVASIKGTYSGTVQLSDKREPSGYRMRAAGSGGPGTISADARISLEEVDGDRTRVDYDADAIVGGMIGGVGQRVLAGVSRKTAAEFFDAIDRELTGAAPVAEDGEVDRHTAQDAGLGAVFRSAARPAGDSDVTRLLLAALAGAALALLGVLVGRRTR